MPEVAREGKYFIRIHVRNEHPPPHVHVYFDEKMVRVGLIGLQIMDPNALKPHEVKPVLAAVRKHQVAALAIWKKIFGDNL